MKNDENGLPPASADRSPEFGDVERDALWSLLGQARPPQISPFFARNVVREIRQHRPVWARFIPLRRWRLVPAAVMVALIACISVSQMIDHPAQNSKRSVDKKEYEVINNLDTLLAAEESSLWLDDSEQ